MSYEYFVGMVVLGLLLIFLAFFPSFVALHYHPEQVSGILALGIPLEEYLYALGFGSMWSVIYSYMHDLRHNKVVQSLHGRQADA